MESLSIVRVLPTPLIPACVLQGCVWRFKYEMEVSKGGVGGRRLIRHAAK
jgi:hypothetical protein